MSKFVSLYIGCLLFISCNLDSVEINTGFFSDGDINLSYTDSATVSLATIRFDSLITSATDRIQAGTHYDNKLGRITAMPAMSFTIPSSIDLEALKATYAYTALTLKYDEYSFYDTTTALTLQVKKLTHDIKTRSTGYLYNTSRFTTESAALGSFTFLPRPHRDDSVEINLTDDFGLELFNKIKDDDEDIASQSEFNKYFKGIAIIPDTTVSSCILGFSSTPELRIYYDDKSQTPPIRKYISINVISSNTYTHIVANRAGTPLSSLQKIEHKILSSSSDHQAYIQGGAGLALRVDMPYLRSLAQLQNFFITKATLEMYPVKKSYSETMPLPGSLVAYQVDKRNSVANIFTVGATLIEDLELERDTRYTMDVTQFVKSQVALEEFNENAIVFTLTDDYNISVNRVYMGDASYDYKAHVRIYFASVNN